MSRFRLSRFYISAAALLCCIVLTSCISRIYVQRRSTLQPYAGQWLLKYSGKNMMLLSLKVHHGQLAGTLTLPEHLTEDWNGNFIGVSLPIITRPAIGRWNHNHVELTLGSIPDQDKMPMRRADDHRLLVARFLGIVPDWKFERVSPDEQAIVDSDWPAYVSDPEVVSIRHQLRSMAEADTQAREKQTIDQNEINTLSDKSRPLLEQI